MSTLTIAGFVHLAENRIAYLGQQQVEAQRIGDVDNLARIEAELGGRPRHDLESGLEATVRWYLKHRDWCERMQQRLQEGRGG